MKLWMLLLLMTLPALARAQFTLTTNNGCITITGYTGAGGSVVIPATINAWPVTSIGNWAFYATSITNVLISDSVTNIGDGAFFDCESLTNVTLGSDVTNLGDWAFSFCPGLASICCRGNVPNLLGSNVFYGTPAKLYYLSSATGWGPTLGGLAAVLSSPPVPFDSTINNDGVSVTITEYTGSDSVVTIPETINFLPVTGIGDNPFYTSLDVTNVLIGSGINAIDDFAFVDCEGLLAINVDTNNADFSSLDGVLFNRDQTVLLAYPRARVGSYAIPASVTDIGACSFEFSEELTGITIPGSVTNIGESAFSYCVSLGNVILPKGLGSIADSLFADCERLSAIAVPDSVSVIGDGAFYDCAGLTNVTIPEGVTNIGDYAFYSCSRLPTIALPNSVTCIGANVFEYCAKLACIALPNHITSIATNMFTWCTGLTEFTIPTNVTSIDDGAFSRCTNLASVTIPTTVVNIGNDSFSGCSRLADVVIPGGVTSIENGVFADCVSLTSIAIPTNVTSIGIDAFVGCSGLTSIVIPDGVTNIGDAAFGACSSLASFTFPDGVTSIGEAEFYSCNNLTNVTIPDSITSIGDFAFNECNSLTSLTIPAGVTNIEDEAFSGCSNLKGCFFYGNPPASIGSYIFSESLNAVVYYLPGTTGWDDFSAEAFCTTAPWLPQMQTGGTNLRPNQFGFDINWAIGQTVEVDACTNLVKPVWQPAQTITLTNGTFYFSDPQSTNFPARFYRLISP